MIDISVPLVLLQNGFSVLPCKSDKRPALPSWGEYQDRLMTPDEVHQYFRNAEKIGVICGAVSGHLECIDFDDPIVYEPFLELIKDQVPDLPAKLLKRQTPSGGYHLIFRCSAPVNGNLKIACDEKGAVRIETRGQGGYFVSAPSPGYKVLERGGMLQCQTLTPDEMKILHATARAFDLREQANGQALRTTPGGTDDRPGDRFNSDHSVSELLAKYGWRQGQRTTAGQGWTRPGKKDGTSGVVLDGTGNFYVWSSNAHPLDPQKTYNPFALYAVCEHGGDFTAAARSLNGQQQARTAITPGPDRQKGTPAADPEPLPDELLPVEPFDFALLPENLQAWAKDISDRLQCPPDYVGVGIMTTLAAVIGRKVGIRPQERTSWTVVCNQWALIIGRPGILKSPAIEEDLGPLKRLVAKAINDHKALYEEYKKGLALAKLKAEASGKALKRNIGQKTDEELLSTLSVDEPEEPILHRYMTNDTSPASLGEVLRHNPNGLLIHRDEMVSLLKGLDREDQAEGRGFYLTGWNGDSAYTIDRIGRGLNLHIEAVCLSLLGGTQPGRISEYIMQAIKGGTADDGLIQRFGLLVWPDNGKSWKNVDRYADTKAKNQAFQIYDYLDKLNPVAIDAQQDINFEGNPEGIPYLRFDQEAADLFLEWRTDLEHRLREGDLHPALESHLAKYRKLIPSLALIIHLADNGSGPVGRDATLKALAWGEYLESHAKRAYGAGSQPDVVTAKAILKRIKKGDLPTSFTARDVYRKGWSMLSDSAKVNDALRLLVDYRHLSEQEVTTAGRTGTVFTLNGGQPA